MNRFKLQIPDTKLQTNPKFQAPNVFDAAPRAFRVLELVWNLELGDSDMSERPIRLPGDDRGGCAPERATSRRAALRPGGHAGSVSHPAVAGHAVALRA